MGKVFGKAFRILGLRERKGSWVVKQEFWGNCWVNVTWFFAFSQVSLTESYSFWYGLKDLFTLHKLVDKVVLTVKTDDITGDRGHVDPHGQLQAVQRGIELLMVKFSCKWSWVVTTCLKKIIK